MDEKKQYVCVVQFLVQRNPRLISLISAHPQVAEEGVDLSSLPP